MLREIKWSDLPAEREETTMEKIQRLSNERQSIWFKAGKLGGKRMEEQDVTRIEEITRELDMLWDRLRRERAALRHSSRTEKRKAWIVSTERGNRLR